MRIFLLMAVLFVLPYNFAMLRNPRQINTARTFINKKSFHYSTVKNIILPQQARYFLKKSTELKSLFPDKVLNRYMRDYQESCIMCTKQIRDEWIRYAVLAKKGKTPLPMFSKSADNMWHTFLLFNKDYEEFCKQLADNAPKSLLYHIPDEVKHGCPDHCQWDQKESFKNLYRASFDCEPDIVVWDGLNPCKSSCTAQQNVDQKTTSPTSCAIVSACASSYWTSACSTSSCSSSSCGGGCGGGCGS